MTRPSARTGTLSRRRFLAAGTVLGATAISAAAADAFLVEPNTVIVTRHRLNVPASPGDPLLRLVQLSDLHLRRIGRHERQIAETVNELAPDLLVITGDSIERSRRLAELDAFLSLLEPRTPKYAILGNWERWAKIDLHRLGAVYGAWNGQLLVNESVVHRHAGREVLMTGLDDLVEGRPDVARALAGVEPRGYHLLLAHCPAMRDRLLTERRAEQRIATGELACHRPQFMFAGHTHGGQINLVGFAPWRPHGSGRYVSGWYRDTRPELYVSRGLGTVMLPVRFGAPPEVAMFELFLAAAAPAAPLDLT